MKKLSARLRETILIVSVMLLCIALYFVPSAPKVASSEGRTVCAEVLDTDNSEIVKNGLVLYGFQKLTVNAGGKIYTAVGLPERTSRGLPLKQLVSCRK